jgi:type II secretory pathway pseudopilin PulG
MKVRSEKNVNGFSIIELIIAMTITLVLLGLVTTLFAKSLATIERENRKTEALTSAQAALSMLSREISNSGFGLTSNGIVSSDSGQSKMHFRANIENGDLTTNSPGEDITYYFDSSTDSIVRYDPNNSPTTTAVINKVSKVTFLYFDYSGGSSTPTQSNTPTNNTGRVRITITVQLDEIQGQPTNQTVEFTSDVTLRNSNYMLNQY